ncbi:hypothetical protein BJF85_14270 [Saccharomonospora sp. CUA-673]|nr:hypothetical protein BJF85_14270 [Saccharomonospora sp. CUA-673]
MALAACVLVAAGGCSGYRADSPDSSPGPTAGSEQQGPSNGETGDGPGGPGGPGGPEGPGGDGQNEDGGPGGDGEQVRIDKLPVPITVQLPAGWRSLDPAQVDAPDAAFFAVHNESIETDFSTNIVVGGNIIEGDTTLKQVAQGEVESLRQDGGDPHVVQEQDGSDGAGPGETPVYFQVVQYDERMGNHQKTLAMAQTLIGFRDQNDRLAVVSSTLTATPERLTEAAPEFEQFVASIRVDDH